MHVFIFSAGTAAAQFSIKTAVNVRVTWNIIPPECVASVTVQFRTQNTRSITD